MMVRNIGISTEEWSALSSGRTVTLARVPYERRNEYKAGDRLIVHEFFKSPSAEVTVDRVVSFSDGNGFCLEVSGFRSLPVFAYGGFPAMEET